MEWQAGYVCGALLMPASHFRAQLTDVQRELGLTGPLLKGTAETDTVIRQLALRFAVSVEAANIRLLKLDLLREPTASGSLF
jgi:Zn-dependent peptidase ImmA (M78 family)